MSRCKTVVGIIVVSHSILDLPANLRVHASQAASKDGEFFCRKDTISILQDYHRTTAAMAKLTSSVLHHSVEFSFPPRSLSLQDFSAFLITGARTFPALLARELRWREQKQTSTLALGPYSTRLSAGSLLSLSYLGSFIFILSLRRCSFLLSCPSATTAAANSRNHPQWKEVNLSKLWSSNLIHCFRPTM